LRQLLNLFFFFQAEDGIRDFHVTGVQTCALPIYEQRTARGSLPRAVLYMEPAGIEPASANGSFSASTCVFRSSSSHPVVGSRTASSGPAPLILIRARRRGTHGPARFVVASGPTSGRVDPETGA